MTDLSLEDKGGKPEGRVKEGIPIEKEHNWKSTRGKKVEQNEGTTSHSV